MDSLRERPTMDHQQYELFLGLTPPDNNELLPRSWTSTHYILHRLLQLRTQYAPQHIDELYDTFTKGTKTTTEDGMPPYHQGRHPTGLT